MCFRLVTIAEETNSEILNWADDSIEFEAWLSKDAPMEVDENDAEIEPKVMLKSSISIVPKKPEVEVPTRGRGRKIEKMAEETEVNPEVQPEGKKPFSFMPERTKTTEPKVAQFAQPTENYYVTPPEEVALNFLNSDLSGEEVWSFIRTLKKSMRWSGQLIEINTFKNVIAALSPSQVYYFLNMSEISGYNYFFIAGSDLNINVHIQHLRMSPLIFSLLTAPARMDIINMANKSDFQSGYFSPILGFTVDAYIKGMGVEELIQFLTLCKGIWMGLEDARIFWLLAKQAAFYGIHAEFGNTVVAHSTQGLDITRFWANADICHEEKMSFVAVFKFSNFGDNRHIKKYLAKLCPEAFSW